MRNVEKEISNTKLMGGKSKSLQQLSSSATNSATPPPASLQCKKGHFIKTGKKVFTLIFTT